MEVRKTVFISLFIFYISIAGRWTVVDSEPMVTGWPACCNVYIVVSQGQLCLCFAEKYLEILVVEGGLPAPLDSHNAILIIVKC